MSKKKKRDIYISTRSMRTIGIDKIGIYARMLL